MFERYTENASRSIHFARYEASQLGSRAIEAQHLLLGILRVMPDELYRFLASGTSIEAIRKKIKTHSAASEKVPTGVEIPQADELKRVLANAGREAERLNQPRVGLEHLLLGLLREEDCYAAQILRERGADADRIRKALEDSSTSTPGGDFGDYT
ncbi:MAG: Clp protease N-terminal domain-containing protein [Terracidiphilus sp.]